jgi:hypothetical protein
MWGRHSQKQVLMKGETEIGVMQLQAKGCLEPAEPKRSKGEFSPGTTQGM